MAVIDVESVEGLVRALRMEADHVEVSLNSAGNFAHNRRVAAILLSLRSDLDDLQDAVDRADADEIRSRQAMRESDPTSTTDPKRGE